MASKSSAVMAIEFFNRPTEEWLFTRGFDNAEVADRALMSSAQQFSGPDWSRLRVRNMDTDEIVRDRLVIRRPALEGEECAMFNTGDPDAPFLKIAFEWHSVH